MCMHARMRRLVWSGDGTYVRRRRPWPARGKICACAFLVCLLIRFGNNCMSKGLGNCTSKARTISALANAQIIVFNY